MYPSPTPVFVGCENVLERIRTCFMDHQEDHPRIFVLHGLGGTGKTQIVSRYIEMTRDEWDEVVYVDASSHEAITNSYQDFFRLKGKGTSVSFDSCFYWPVSGRWLLVFDGADDPTSGIDKFFPKDWFARRCYILITSRHRDLSLLARGPQSDCHISGMSGNDSHELLMKTARLQADELTDEENEAAVALVQDFGYLPLAIAHAGAYIWKSSRTIAQYRSIYLKQKQTLLEEYGKMPIKIDSYERTVHATWMLSYERLSDNAKHLLWLLSFLHLDGIPGDIFQRAKTYLATNSPQIPPTEHELKIRLLAERHLAVWSDAEGQWSELDFLPIISELLSLSLVKYDRINQTYSLHALVHTWAATVVPNKTETLNCAAFLLAASAGWSSKLEDVVFRRKLVLHVDNVMSQGSVTSANLISEFVQVYLDNLRFAQAAALTAQVIDATSQTLGDKHPMTLAKQSLLASVYGHQDRWKDAEMLQIQILDDRRKVLGAGCVDTLDSLNDLAQTYSEQGRFKESETLAAESLAIRQRVFGEGDSGCLATMALLSDVLRKQNKVEKFNTMLDSALRALGSCGDFPVASSLEDLAFSYAKRGQLRFNQKMMMHHLIARGKFFGRNHPETLRAECWLATARYYNHQGGLKTTESWENIVKRLKDRLGEEHPSTLSGMGWLAESYHSKMELEKAEALQQRVVELRNVSKPRSARRSRATPDAGGERSGTSPREGTPLHAREQKQPRQDLQNSRAVEGGRGSRKASRRCLQASLGGGASRNTHKYE
ncbi:hypothetical protein FRC12_018566 [Ceratobasidium sp. 428]|nr:hypothetical protein FRC12_018566 [Ceratobasidium sp. 428]